MTTVSATDREKTALGGFAPGGRFAVLALDRLKGGPAGRFWEPFFIVTHHDPAFPAVVFLFPYHVIAGRSAFCHDDTPSLSATQHTAEREE